MADYTRYDGPLDAICFPKLTAAQVQAEAGFVWNEGVVTPPPPPRRPDREGDREDRQDYFAARHGATFSPARAEAARSETSPSKYRMDFGWVGETVENADYKPSESVLFDNCWLKAFARFLLE